MIYHSTRGQSSTVDFETALLSGLAPDGGLYLPEHWPTIDAQSLRGASYADVAARVIAPYTGAVFSLEELTEICRDVYGQFDHDDVAPVRNFSNEDFLLELFHGPTLAFKDFAMQLLGRLFDRVLKRRGLTKVILAATSGDTGAAAIDALKNCEQVVTVVLHPEGRVTEVQRRMMTTIDRPNVLNLAVEGDFDQCQAIVKSLFHDRQFVDEVALGAVNSINWGRIAAQIVYYFTAWNAVVRSGEAISFVTPTGNFGDIFAGYAAKQMGLPVSKLVIATNQNDILPRTLKSGEYRPDIVAPSYSPSMDIQVASNFERLLFCACGGKSDVVVGLMRSLEERGAFHLSDEMLSAVHSDFNALSISDDDTLDEIADHQRQTGNLIDPHTAVGLATIKRLRKSGDLTGTVVTLSTAHPAKFPEAVKKACGTFPSLPPRHQELFDKPERFTRMGPALAPIKDTIRALVRSREAG